MRLPVSIDWKRQSYDLIFVIIDRFTKIMYYESIKITINALSLAKVIINAVVRHHDLLDSIITD